MPKSKSKICRSAEDDVVRNMLNQISESFSIIIDDAPGFPIVPHLITKEQEEKHDAVCSNDLVREGEVEYNVSNRRCWNHDVYSWKNAVKTAKELQQKRNDDKDRRGMP